MTTIILTVAIILLGVSLIFQAKKLIGFEKELEKTNGEVQRLKTYSKPSITVHDSGRNINDDCVQEELFEQLLEQLGKKITRIPIRERFPRGWHDGAGFREEIVDLTDKEKEIKQLRKRADELEEETE